MSDQPQAHRMGGPIASLTTSKTEPFLSCSLHRACASSSLMIGTERCHGWTPADRYLAWAFVAAANFAMRHSPTVQRFSRRKQARTNGVVAPKAVAHRLARATYDVWHVSQPAQASHGPGWVGLIRLCREPARGWPQRGAIAAALRTCGHGLVPTAFWGPARARGQEPSGAAGAPWALSLRGTGAEQSAPTPPRSKTGARIGALRGQWARQRCKITRKKLCRGSVPS